MAKNIERIAEKLGAEIVDELPDVGGGAFGAARLTLSLRHRLVPSEGRRPGRPTVEEWTRRDKVPMSEATYDRLKKVADEGSTDDRKISPMQVAAQVLEEAVKRL